jgi:DNA replicative helicase MCM subunit Mcm2 (Cdc46/Mcm family)
MEIVAEQPQDEMDDRFKELLLNDLNSSKNQKLIQQMINSHKNRFSVDLDDLRENYDDGQACANFIVRKPQTAIKFIERTLNNIVDDLKPEGKLKSKGTGNNV